MILTVLTALSFCIYGYVFSAAPEKKGGEDFIGQDLVTLVLGDNIFFGEGLSARLQEVSE